MAFLLISYQLIFIGSVKLDVQGLIFLFFVIFLSLIVTFLMIREENVMNDMSSTIYKLRTDTTFHKNTASTQLWEGFREATETDFQFASREVHGGDPKAQQE